MKKGWKIEKLGNLCEKITDGTHVTPTYVSEGVPFLSVKNLTNGFIDFSDTRFISREEHEILTKRVRPERDDILYTKVGTTGIAKVVDVDEEFSIFVSVALLKIKHDLIFNRFLEHFLNSPIAREQAQKRTRGMANKNLVITDIKEIEIHYPTSLPEQQRIVSMLDKALASFGQVKDNAERNLVNARELFETASNNIISDSNKDWKETKLGEICDFTRGPFGGSLKKNIFKKTGYAVYEQRHAIHKDYSEIRYFIDEAKFKEMERFELRPGDLIMSCSGVTLGRVSIAPKDMKLGIINQALLKLTPIDKKISAEFLKLWMESESFQTSIRAYSGGAAIPNVASVKILKEIPIHLPPLAEQRAIVGRLEALSAETGRLEEIYQSKVEALEELKKSVLGKAFEGEI